MLKIILYIVIFATFSCAEDYYKLLGVERNADQREIRRAFKKLAITEHPDKKNDDPNAHEKFIVYTTAYEVLKDPELRKKYDLYGEEGLDDNKRQRSYHSYTYYQDNFGIYDDDLEITTLNNDDFFESVIDSEKMWFINFYSPMCSHCHHLAPVWRKIAKDLEGVIRIGAVNCEDDWHICNNVHIQSYPTLLYFPKKSKNGIKYTGLKTHEAIMRFVLDNIDADIRELSRSAWNLLLKGKEPSEKPTIVFICGENRNCFTKDERLKIAAIFDKIVNVRVFNCKKNDNCASILTDSTGVIYLPSQKDTISEPILFEDIEEIEDLVKKVLEQLPEPKDINNDELDEILEKLKYKSNVGWLICFYMGHVTEFDVLLKQLPSILQDVNLAKINCGRHPNLCQKFNINHYPSWGVLKPGGAFELSHGKSTMNDIANFAKTSLKAKNVWSLSADKIHSIMQRKTEEAWFLDWYTPWCPPCLKFLPEVRKASLEFDKSVIRFGTIDCTMYPDICRQYSIQFYPTGLLVNGSRLLTFNSRKTASNLVDFINEAMNPSVIHLNPLNFNFKLEKKKSKELWVVDYFAPWCGPCQQLMPEWTKVAKSLKLLSFVKVASIDCEAEKDLCQSQNIRSYPTIRLYPTGSEGISSVALFSGERDHSNLLRWISHFFPVKVKELNEYSMQTYVLDTDEPVIVDYYAPWCGHCHFMEPQFAIAAQLLNKKVRFARLNCDQYHELCNQAGVKAYPTLILYDDKKNLRHLGEGIRIRATTAEVLKKEISILISGKNKNNNNNHDEL